MSIEKELEALLKREGGYVNDPSDSGGETNWGITVAVAREYGYQGSMKNLTREYAKDIYRRKYWEKPGFDRVATVSDLLAYRLFDIGVNMGVVRAGEFLQRLLNVLNRIQADYPDIKVDGDVGPATLRCLAAFYAKRGPPGVGVLIKGLTALQGSYYIELAERREKDEKFVYGWLINRVV